MQHDDDDLARLMLARSPRFLAMLQRSRQSMRKGEGLSEKAFWEAVRTWAHERKAAAVKGPKRGGQLARGR
jgi:hypothetical protein